MQTLDIIGSRRSPHFTRVLLQRDDVSRHSRQWTQLARPHLHRTKIYINQYGLLIDNLSVCVRACVRVYITRVCVRKEGDSVGCQELDSCVELFDYSVIRA
jgi:hypothetical protein